MIDLYNAVKLKPLTDTVCIKDISDEVYFSKAYGNYISNSRLKLINPDEGGSPSKFFAGLNNNKIYSDALIFGSAVHELTLQPNDFVLTEIDRPTAKAGFMADYIWDNYLEAAEDNIGELIDSLEDSVYIEASNEIDYYKGKMNDEKIAALKDKCYQYWTERAFYEAEHVDGPTPIYLPAKTREQLLQVLEAFNKNKKFVDLLHPSGLLEDPISMNETTILMDMEYTVTLPEGEYTGVLHLKSKLDNYTIDGENNTITVNDVKTTGKYVTEFDNGAFKFFHYYRELGMYTWLLRHAAAKEYNIFNPTIKSNCLVVETFPGYFTKTYELTKGDLLKGMQEFGWLLRQVAYFTAKRELQGA
jgi:hypothetical protein